MLYYIIVIRNAQHKRQQTNCSEYTEISDRHQQRFDKHYSEFFSLDMLEKEYNVSKYRIVKDFTRIIRHHRLITFPNDALRPLKRCFCRLIIKSTKSGRMVGYENSTHFINSFKKQTGSTPLHYKKENSNNF